jgi:zinc and cadmium transporter
MSVVYLYAFISVIIISLISFVGIFTLFLNEEKLQKNIFIFVSLATGALLGDAFIHIIPEAFENGLNPTFISILIISGILFFFIIEKFLHWHHHGEDKENTHIHPVGKLVILSDGVHNFIDGLIIGASYLVSIPIGIATTIAVILHEIPQEIGDFGVLIHAGYTKKRALWLNFLSAILALAGVFISFLLGNLTEFFVVWILPFAAGGFIYIATSDLMPELQKTKKAQYSVHQILAIIIGVMTMLLLVLIE